MDDLTLIILVLLEAILLLIVLSFYLYLRNRALQRRLNESPEHAVITATRSHENTAVFAQRDTAVSEEGTVEEAQPDDELLLLRERVTVLQEHIDSLEQFKEMFFDLKDKIASQESLIDRLKIDLEQAISDGADLSMLQATVDQLAYEKADLQDRVASMSEQLAKKQTAETVVKPDLTAEPAPEPKDERPAADSTASRVESVNQSGRQMSEEVENMREVLTGQGTKIQEMGQLIGELRLEVSDRDRLKQIAFELEGKASDLKKAVNRLEQENNFLQDQISALLKQEVSKDEQFTEELQRIQERLASKESAYSELEKKYTAMEQQYLEASGQLQERSG